MFSAELNGDIEIERSDATFCFCFILTFLKLFGLCAAESTSKRNPGVSDIGSCKPFGFIKTNIMKVKATNIRKVILIKVEIRILQHCSKQKCKIPL